MAIVRTLEYASLEVEAKHTEATATYTIVKGRDADIYLQIDTYGSVNRKYLKKKSQSIRFSKEAIGQLRLIIEEIDGGC